MPQFSSSVELRRLRHAVEPIAASVYFSPEPNKAYAELGLNVFEGYFCSRSAAAGKLSGPVAASMFGFFNVEVVTRALESGWSKAEPEAVLTARLSGAAAALGRLLTDPPVDEIVDIFLPAMLEAPAEGRPLFAAWREIGAPDDPLARLWWSLDLFREHRGGGHVAASTSSGLDPIEAGLLNEAWYGYARGTYIRTFGWSADQIDSGLESLRAKQLLDGDGLTDAGRELREEIEMLTDRSQGHVAATLADEIGHLADLLEPFADQVVEGGGYPFGRHT